MRILLPRRHRHRDWLDHIHMLLFLFLSFTSVLTSLPPSTCGYMRVHAMKPECRTMTGIAVVGQPLTLLLGNLFPGDFYLARSGNNSLECCTLCLSKNPMNVIILNPILVHFPPHQGASLPFWKLAPYLNNACHHLHSAAFAPLQR